MTRIDNEDIDKFFDEVSEYWVDHISKVDREITIGQYCKTQGMVIRSIESGFNLCDDSECSSCSMWKDQFKKYIDENF